MVKKIIVLFILLYGLLTIGNRLIYAEDKVFSEAGDGSSWSDEDNWSPAIEPTVADDVLIDKQDASVFCTKTYKAKSITIGGKETSSLTSNNFVYGTISPDSSSEVAILNRKDGKFSLKGAGVVTLQGKYQDSEEVLPVEPSFMFWVE